jgi:hypothetical protein
MQKRVTTSKAKNNSPATSGNLEFSQLKKCDFQAKTERKKPINLVKNRVESHS